MTRLLFQIILGNMLRFFTWDKWSTIGFSGVAATGWASFLDYSDKIIPFIGGITLILLSIWQKWRDDRRKQLHFEAEEKRLEERHNQEIQQDEREFKKTGKNKK